MKPKIIKQTVEVRPVVREVERADEPGVIRYVVDEFKVEHHDGSVSVVLTPADAVDRIKREGLAQVRRLERKGVAAIVVTRITWHDTRPGLYEVPTTEVTS